MSFCIANVGSIESKRCHRLLFSEHRLLCNGAADDVYIFHYLVKLFKMIYYNLIY